MSVSQPDHKEMEALVISWRKTPQEDIDAMKASCITNDIARFKSAFDKWSTHGLDIHELSDLAEEAISHDNVQALSILVENRFQGLGGSARSAIEHRSKDVLAYMLETGWDINKFAVKDEDMLPWLLDHGADPNQQSLIDLTPMSYAVKETPISTIELLLDRGADVSKGQLLHRAIERESDEIAVLDLLLQRGAPLNARRYDNHPYSAKILFFYLPHGTALHHASGAGKHGVVQFLLDQGADPTIMDTKGKFALAGVRP
ncbi:hypothetical protein BDW74DRAFT_166168 [Aspergillus multicolor]|uniref:ankyrin repeat domain-containing protein n=1 Tax=Aspergillus multicolor TaxID=41759 RepID=UPI003CCDB6C3